MMRISHRLRLLALLTGVCLTANTTLRAATVLDPVNDLRTFVPGNSDSYAGPANPALDVQSLSVTLDPSQTTLTFTQTMAGPIAGLINPTTGGLLGSYSWGINHGYSNLNFNEIGLQNVLFDSVLTLNPDGTGRYSGSTVASNPLNSVTVSGNTLTAVLQVSFLAPPAPPNNPPGRLLPVFQWSFNLWPRSSFLPDGTTSIPFGDAQIADFAPDTTDIVVQFVPEPSSVVILGLGLLGTGCWVRFRTRRASEHE